MSLLNLQSLGFLNKKKTLFLDFKKFRLTGQTSILLKISGCIQPPSLGIRCIFYDFDLYKTQKTHENTREDSLHNISVILSAVWYAKTKFSRASFWDVFLNLQQTSRKKNAGNTFEDRSFSRKAPLDVSQSLYIEYLHLISSLAIKFTNKVHEAAP